MKTLIIGSINSGNILHILLLGVIVTGIGYWSYFRSMEKSSAMAHL
jgi:drug/metabolite transporter (DMT)-like permease